MSQREPSEERTVLARYLNGQRKHVLDILDGLPDESMRRPVLPSAWTCAALLHHLAIDVEQFWFRAVVAGEQPIIDQVLQGIDGWQVAEDTPVASIFDRYRREIDLADGIITGTPLDAAPAWWPDFFGDYRLRDLREVILHVIEETACHAGHLDVVRELIDGQQWLVLTE